MPSTLLLAVHCKRSEPVRLKDAALEYVKATYGQKAADDATDDLDEVEELRAQAVNQSVSLPALRDTLARYHRLLCVMESRFPISKARDHVAVTFSWYDAFRSNKRTDQANIHFEKAAVVFNVGAALSQIALGCDRKTVQGLLDSARLFQEAAGAFSFLRDSSCLKVDMPRPVDLTPECAGMLERLMLAQAQECVLERAAADGKAPSTQARLAKQVALFYDDCSRLLTAKPLSDHFDRSWQAHATVKSLLYHLEADLQNAAALRTEDELKGVANEIARLRAAQGSLAGAKKEAKAASKDLQDNVAAKEAAVAERLARAERENATVYLQRVPPAADLPGIVPAALVKPLPPADLRPTSDTDRLFSGVVPDTSAKSLSKYTALVDSLVRRQMDALGAASDEARVRLREWELPESLQALDPGSTTALPDALRVELEAVQAAGGGAHLQELAAQIRELRSVATADLDAAEAELRAEAREDEELRAHYGQRWRRPPSAQLTAVLWDKARGYRGNLAAAAASDGVLEGKLAAESGAIAALDPVAAATQMPRLQAPMLSVDDMEPATAVATLRHALEGLSTLSSQRAALEEALKGRRNGDHILPRLLSTSAADADALFAAEVAKYGDLVQGVEENVAKQAQLLEVISASQRVFRQAYNFDEWRRACERAAQGVRGCVAKHAELQANLSEGLRFYSSLQDAIGALRQQIGDHCATRRIQRDEMLEDLKRAAAAQEAAAAQQLAAMSMNAQQPQRPPPQQSGYPQYSGHAAAPPPPPPQQQQQQQYYGQQPQYQHQYQSHPPPAPPQQQQWQPPAYTQSPPYHPPPQQQQNYQQASQPATYPYVPAPPPQQLQTDLNPYGSVPLGGPPQQATQPPPQQSTPLAGFFALGGH